MPPWAISSTSASSVDQIWRFKNRASETEKSRYDCANFQSPVCQIVCSFPEIESAPTFVWDPIKGSLGQLRATQESLEHFLDQLFNELEEGERHDATNEEALRQQIETLSADRIGVEGELDAAREEITRLSGIAVELANVRAELAETRAKSGRLRDQLATAVNSEQEFRSALAEAEIERRSLDSEVDILRAPLCRIG